MIIDWNGIFGALTGFSTFAMAVIAFKALNTWKKEFSVKKKTEVYDNLLSDIFEIIMFLDNLNELLFQNPDEKCKEELTSYSKKLKLLAIKIHIIKNEKIYKLVDSISKDIEPIKYYNEKLEEGSYSMRWNYFTDMYRNNSDKFKDNIDKDLSNIINLCSDELQKFYK